MFVPEELTLRRMRKRSGAHVFHGRFCAFNERGGPVEPGGAVSDCSGVDVVVEAVVVFGW